MYQSNDIREPLKKTEKIKPVDGNENYGQPNRVRENPHWIWSTIFNVPNMLFKFLSATISTQLCGLTFGIQQRGMPSLFQAATSTSTTLNAHNVPAISQ